MHEIGMRPGGQTVKDRMRADGQFIPAHMRDFQLIIIRLDLHHFTGDPVQPRCIAMFMAGCRHQLHADTNAKKRRTAPMRPLFQSLHHAWCRIQPCPAIGIGPDTRQHDAIRLQHILGAGGDENLLARPFPAHALKGFLG